MRRGSVRGLRVFLLSSLVLAGLPACSRARPIACLPVLGRPRPPRQHLRLPWARAMAGLARTVNGSHRLACDQRRRQRRHDGPGARPFTSPARQTSPGGRRQVKMSNSDTDYDPDPETHSEAASSFPIFQNTKSPCLWPQESRSLSPALHEQNLASCYQPRPDQHRRVPPLQGSA